MLSDAVLRSAMASKLAYAKDTRTISVLPASRILHTQGSKEIHTFVDDKRTRAHAYVWDTGETSKIVAFRGSTTANDIFKYVFSKSKSFSFCEHKMRIHGQVLDVFHSIECDLTPVIKDTKHITFCGHSMGGCIAMFAAAYYSAMFATRKNIVCHSFGSPKMGDQGFIKWLGASALVDFICVKNSMDIVPSFPLFDQEIKSVPLIELNTTTGVSNPWKDHDLDTYIENIIKNMEKKN